MVKWYHEAQGGDLRPQRMGCGRHIVPRHGFDSRLVYSGSVFFLE
jgi:hypothetical protein